MANFPTSVTAFTTKNVGDTIQPSDVNTLQNEVNAIEDGYINGTAPLNSSNARVNNLNVAGNSSVSGTLTVGGVLTLSTTFAPSGLNVSGASTLGTLSVSGNSTFANRPTMPPPDAVQASGAFASLSSGSVAGANIGWLTNVFATNAAMHSTGAIIGGFLPQSTGVYQAIVTVRLASALTASTAVMALQILDSSNAVLAEQRVPNTVGYQPVLTLSAIKRFDAIGGYLQANVFAADSSTNSLSATGSFFTMTKL